MTYPQIIKYLRDNGSSADVGLFMLQDDGEGSYIKEWDESLPAKPEEKDLDDPTVALVWYRQQQADKAADIETKATELQAALSAIVSVLNSRTEIKTKITEKEVKAAYDEAYKSLI